MLNLKLVCRFNLHSKKVKSQIVQNLIKKRLESSIRIVFNLKQNRTKKMRFSADKKKSGKQILHPPQNCVSAAFPAKLNQLLVFVNKKYL